jgi:hypothetical protein
MKNSITISLPSLTFLLPTKYEIRNHEHYHCNKLFFRVVKTANMETVRIFHVMFMPFTHTRDHWWDMHRSLRILRERDHEVLHPTSTTDRHSTAQNKKQLPLRIAKIRKKRTWTSKSKCVCASAAIRPASQSAHTHTHTRVHAVVVRRAPIATWPVHTRYCSLLGPYPGRSAATRSVISGELLEETARSHLILRQKDCILSSVIRISKTEVRNRQFHATRVTFWCHVP